MDKMHGIHWRPCNLHTTDRICLSSCSIDIRKLQSSAICIAVLILLLYTEKSTGTGDSLTFLRSGLADSKWNEPSETQIHLGGVLRREKRSMRDLRTVRQHYRRTNNSKFSTNSRRKSRRKRESIFQPSPLESSGGLTIWPNNCHVTKNRHTSLGDMVIFECAPTSIRFLATTGDDQPVLPAITGISAYAVGNVTNSPTVNISQTTETIGRHVRDMYALSDVMVQFSVPSDVTELRLWYQGIVSIEKNAFINVGKSLKVLNLQQNGISYLSVDAFAGLTNLTELDISYNRLQSIPSVAFQHLPSLEVLKLDHNEISYIQNSLFCGARSLVTLDLSHNAIEDIGPHALKHFETRSAVSIELGHNKLSRPRSEWVERVPSSLKTELCIKDGGNTEKITSTVRPVGNTTTDNDDVIDGGEMGDTDGERTGPIRILQAAHNPWFCACDASLELVKFLRTYHSPPTASRNDVIRNSYSENDTTTESSEVATPNATTTNRFFRWYFTMPCVGPPEMTHLDLGRLLTSETSAIERTCCTVLGGTQGGDKIISGDPVLGDACAIKNETNDDHHHHLSDNQVTVIGIVIVFSTPILLTLCPDCDKAIHPSGGGGMMSAGKFGVSMNTTFNNNVYPETNEMLRNSDFRTVGASRLYGMLTSKRSDYAEDLV